MVSRPIEPVSRSALDHSLSAAELAAAGSAALFFGGLLGACGALYIRRRQLTWTWAVLTLALPPFPVAVFFAGLIGAKGLVVALVAALAAPMAALGLGLYLRIEDRRAGGDRDAARARRRGLMDGMRRRRAERGARGRSSVAGGLPVGRTGRGELAMVERGSASSGSHVLIPGATGAGKTTSLAALLVDYVARSGFGAIVLEAKADATLLSAARSSARSRGVRFWMLSPQGPASYDPLAHGSVDERSERLIAVEGRRSADGDFYRQAASPFLRMVIRSLDSSGRRATLSSVAEYCALDRLENLSVELEDQALTEEITATIEGLGADQRRAISGLGARLANLASSDFAREWLEPGRPGGFDLRRVVEDRDVAYFRFDTDRTGTVGRAVAQMVLLDLGAAASELMGRGVGTFVAIDEFGALEAPALDRLYARGRAAGFSVAVGTQTLADLRAAGPAVRERIGATVSSIVCHRIGEQADAEWVAQLIGAVPAWQSTIRTNGLGLPTAEGTRTRGYRYEVNPSELQRLAQGDVFVARLDQAGSVRALRARVVPPWQRLRQIGVAG
jgi:hypothetical protein